MIHLLYSLPQLIFRTIFHIFLMCVLSTLLMIQLPIFVQISYLSRYADRLSLSERRDIDVLNPICAVSVSTRSFFSFINVILTPPLFNLLFTPSDVGLSILIHLTRHEEAHQIVVHAESVINLVQIDILPFHEEVQLFFGKNHLHLI